MEKENETKLIIIGGGEDKRADKEILREVVKLSAKKAARIGVLTTASSYPLEVGEEYRQLFYELEAESVEIIHLDSRQQANSRQMVKSLEGLGCVFFVGGDQLRISSLLGGTGFHKALHELIRLGGVVAGTSAGASMMSEIMVVAGLEEEAPKKSAIRLASGMGLLEGVIIDQHFNQRGRIGRLLGAVAQNPQVLGIGIDEDTALLVDRSNQLKVMGSGVVTIVDGNEIAYTNISEQSPNEPLAITNVKVHILPENYGFHIPTRRVLLPSS